MSAESTTEVLPRHPVEGWEAHRDDWIVAVEKIVSDAEAWATEQKWFVHRDRKTITESRLGSYQRSP